MGLRADCVRKVFEYRFEPPEDAEHLPAKAALAHPSLRRAQSCEEHRIPNSTYGFRPGVFPTTNQPYGDLKPVPTSAPCQQAPTARRDTSNNLTLAHGVDHSTGAHRVRRACRISNKTDKLLSAPSRGCANADTDIAAFDTMTQSMGPGTSAATARVKEMEAFSRFVRLRRRAKANTWELPLRYFSASIVSVRRTEASGHHEVGPG